MYRYLFRSLHSVLLGAYPGVDFLGHLVSLCFWVVVPFYISTPNVQGFQFHHIIINMYFPFVEITAILECVKWCLILIGILMTNGTVLIGHFYFFFGNLYSNWWLFNFQAKYKEDVYQKSNNCRENTSHFLRTHEFLLLHGISVWKVSYFLTILVLWGLCICGVDIFLPFC